jgi:hypothetical protein
MIPSSHALATAVSTHHRVEALEPTPNNSAPCGRRFDLDVVLTYAAAQLFVERIPVLYP